MCLILFVGLAILLTTASFPFFVLDLQGQKVGKNLPNRVTDKYGEHFNFPTLSRTKQLAGGRHHGPWVILMGYAEG